MTKIVDHCFEVTGRPAFICDFSPPRSGDPATVAQARFGADFISVAYNPGRTVRANSAMLATAIKSQTGQEVAFTLATRDMNQLALQSQLLGAQMLGLENLIVVQGDLFSERDLALVGPVNQVTPTGLIASITNMNQGTDFRDAQLRSATDFCIGATVDLGRGVEPESHLARRKVEAGAHFLITQPIFDPAEASRFIGAYADAAGEPPGLPIFFGLQVLEHDGIIFSTVPEQIREELAGGRSGVDLAIELFQSFQEAGIHDIYLVPPIRRGGARNYQAAQELLETVRRGPE